MQCTADASISRSVGLSSPMNINCHAVTTTAFNAMLISMDFVVGGLLGSLQASLQHDGDAGLP
jgi:hypothetical protein